MVHMKQDHSGIWVEPHEDSLQLMLASHYIQTSNYDDRGFLKEKMGTFITDLNMHLAQKSEKLKEKIL